MSRLLPLSVLAALALTACAPAQLAGPVVQVPTFEARNMHLSSLTLAPAGGLPGGGQGAAAGLELTVQMYNPNPFPVRLHSFSADLFLTGQRAAALILPDVALPARGTATQTVQASVPVNLNVAAEWLKVARGQAVPYRVDGSFTADLGVLGQPTFGPLTLVQGQWRQAPVLP